MNRANSTLTTLAERLLKHEIAADKSALANESAAFRVSEKLRHPLSTLAGAAGFQALLARALALARAEVKALSAVQVRADGTLDGLSNLEPSSDRSQIADGEIILIAHVLGLLVTFIGETLTMSLVRNAWPEIAFEDLHIDKGNTP